MLSTITWMFMNGKINSDQTNGKGVCTSFTFHRDTQNDGVQVRKLLIRLNQWKAKPLVY